MTQTPSPPPGTGPSTLPGAVRPVGPSLPPPSFQTLRVILALVLREMGSTYGNSPGGYIWAIVSPVGALAVMSFAFSLMLRSPSLGTSFILFYATGYLPFEMFSQLSTKIGGAVRYSRSLLAYPRVTWMDAAIARLVLNTVTGATVFCVVIFGIMLVVETRTVLSIGPILVGFGVIIMNGLGLGLTNCLLTGYFPAWARIWEIVSRPMFLVSGVLFLYSEVPPAVQDIMWWNPVLHGISMVRSGFYPTYHPDYVSLPYAFGLPMVLMAFSLVFLRRGYLAAFDR